MARTAVYELRIGGKLACRGDADDIAGALGVAPDTIRGYVSNKSPRGVEITRLPKICMVDGEGPMTLERASELIGLPRKSVMHAIFTTRKLRGHSLSYAEYKRESIPIGEIDDMLAEERSAGW